MGRFQGLGVENQGENALFNCASDEQKQAISKYIYEFMLKEGFDSPKGYLVVDVLRALMKDIGDGGGGHEPRKRFSALLRSETQYFKIFSAEIRTEGGFAWLNCKGAEMVRLVRQENASIISS